MNTQSNAMPESFDSPNRTAPVVTSRPGPCTGRCGANCGRTARSISRRWSSPAVVLFGFLIGTHLAAPWRDGRSARAAAVLREPIQLRGDA